MKKSIPKKNESITISIEVFLFKENGFWISYAPSLLLTSQGRTRLQSQNRFQEVLEIFIEDTTERGTLERCLLDCGWLLQLKPQPMYRPPVLSFADFREFTKDLPKDSYTINVNFPIAI